MKNLCALVSILLISLFSSAQKVGGFYKGTLFNDSTKMTQQYELALAEYRGKIMGYSYVTFVANDTFYYGIRKIRAKIEGDSLVVEDDKMIANNFPEAPAKHVNRTVTIPFNGQDSLVSVNGKWKTNKTKIYYSVPGSVEASKSNDSSGSALFAHLKELNLMPDANYVATETDSNKKAGKSKSKEDNKPPVIETSARTNEAPIKSKSKEKQLAENTQPVVLAYSERKEHLQQAIDVNTDSLILSFYDNGVVDGDSISVYLNGLPIITGTKLTAVATKKSIYIGSMNEVKLLLVAENLGTIPPNTGLLVIKDGEKTYHVNFTADMQTNAGIVLKRKRN